MEVSRVPLAPQEQVLLYPLWVSPGPCTGWGFLGHCCTFLIGLRAVSGGFPCGSAGKESTCNVGDLGSIPGLGCEWSQCPLPPLFKSAVAKSLLQLVQGQAMRSSTRVMTVKDKFAHTPEGRREAGGMEKRARGSALPGNHTCG